MGQCCASGGSRANIERLFKDEGRSSLSASSDPNPGRARERNKRKQTTKLLLLGTGNSGKSTVFKQFQLLHNNGFTESERDYYRKLMVDSTIATIRKLLQNANDLLFEGEMRESDINEKGIMVMMKNAQSGRAAGSGGPDGDEERLAFSQILDGSLTESGSGGGGSGGGGGGSTPSGSRATGGGRSTVDLGSRAVRESDLSETSAVGGRRTDLSEYEPKERGSTLGRKPSKDTGSLTEANIGSESKGDADVTRIPVHTGRGSALGIGSSRKARGAEATVIGEEVAHLADIIKDLPPGTKLHDTREVISHRRSISGEMEESIERLTVVEMLKLVWEDPVIQRVYSMEGKMPTLEAPIAYYMEHIDRIARADFEPTEEDMLYSRKQTRKVQELAFKVEGRRFELIDVGGQRIERRKWINYFDNVDAVIFVVGLDGYNQLCIEDGKTNRMRESLQLFKDICDSPFFSKTSFLLFLNKSDIFAKKIKTVPLSVCFRSYTGPQHDYEKCVQYIRKRFEDTHTRHVQRHISVDVLAPKVYPHVTCATATEQMRFVIATCQSIFLRKGLAQCGIAAM